jgi:hypothetical protein
MIFVATKGHGRAMDQSLQEEVLGSTVTVLRSALLLNFRDQYLDHHNLNPLLGGC